MGEPIGKKNPSDVYRDEVESERFRAKIRAANRSASDAPSLPSVGDEPPFPKPVESVLRMPSDTEDAQAAKRAAAREWLVAFCERARFLLKTRDLRLAARTTPECQQQIDRIRPLLSAEDIDAILEGV